MQQIDTELRQADSGAYVFQAGRNEDEGDTAIVMWDNLTTRGWLCWRCERRGCSECRHARRVLAIERADND